MMNRLFYFIVLIIFAAGFISCDFDEAGPPSSVRGYAPVYFPKTNNDTLKFVGPQPTEKAGKIVLKGDLLYQVEQYKGIHIIDFRDANNAKKIGFYEIFGSTELTIKDHYMYTNSGTAFIVIDIADLFNPRVVDYRPDYWVGLSFPPPPGNGYFECPDPQKGIVISWSETILHNPKCKL